MKNNKKAFTLSEVLIAMTVIGFISMLTIPALKLDDNERQYLTSAKKALNSFQTATSLIEVDHGDYTSWKSNGNALTWYQNMMTADGTDIKHKYKATFDGTDTESEGWFSTSDGMYWLYDNGTMLVDINGKSDPNIAGVDIFNFEITDNGVVGADDCTKYVIRIGEMPWLNDTSMTSCPSS